MDSTHHNTSRRIVITGMGAVTPLGTVPELWANLKQGTSGIRRIQSIDTDQLDVKIAAEVDVEPADYIPYKEARRMARASLLASIAAQMAQDDARLADEYLTQKARRVGVTLGTAQGGYEVAGEALLQFRNEGTQPSPFALLSALPNMPGHHISREVSGKGPLTVISTACASGTQSIGFAADTLKAGRADIMFTGGAEALILDYIIAGFTSTRAIATGFNETPAAASRPFDADRNGFVLGEGAAILVLETLEHALEREAPIYAEVLGHGETSDALHAAIPDPEGKGAQHAMQLALTDAGLTPDEIDYINAHGTGTPANDVMETKAIKAVFGDRASQIPISSTKSMIGHALGATGAIEAVACVMTLNENVIHPTTNLDTPDPDCDLDYVPHVAREQPVSTVLSNSFGLGGQNSCLILGAIDPA